jgi:hypothetical protein
MPARLKPIAMQPQPSAQGLPSPPPNRQGEHDLTGQWMFFAPTITLAPGGFCSQETLNMARLVVLPR